MVALRAEETLALMGATRLASGIVQLLFSRVCIVFFSFIIPTRDASPPLEVAFSGTVLMVAFIAEWHN